MAEFFSMGGYAAYVWPSYAVAATVLIALLVASLRSLRKRETVLRRLEEARPRRRRAERKTDAGGPPVRAAAEGSEG